MSKSCLLCEVLASCVRRRPSVWRVSLKAYFIDLFLVVSWLSSVWGPNMNSAFVWVLWFNRLCLRKVSRLFLQRSVYTVKFCVEGSKMCSAIWLESKSKMDEKWMSQGCHYCNRFLMYVRLAYCTYWGWCSDVCVCMIAKGNVFWHRCMRMMDNMQKENKNKKGNLHLLGWLISGWSAAVKSRRIGTSCGTSHFF